MGTKALMPAPAAPIVVQIVEGRTGASLELPSAPTEEDQPIDAEVVEETVGAAPN
jgi:hypothetical protein